MNAQALDDSIWALLALASLAAVVSSHLHGARLARLSVVVRRLERHDVLYLALVVGWMWMGWHFFAR